MTLLLRFLQRSAQCSGCRAIPLLKTSHLSLETTGSFLPAVAAAVIPQRCNSNTAGISKINRRIYARSYPTILVQPDGSTIRIRYKEPYKIIKLPLDIETLGAKEKAKRLLRRKPREKLAAVEELEDSFDSSQYVQAYSKKKKGKK